MSEATGDATPIEPAQPDIRDRLNLDWLDATPEWGIRASAGRHGMTLSSINIGTYGVIPEIDEIHTELPRGAYAKPGALPSLSTLVHRDEVWSDLGPALYEEGVQRRWRPAIDVAWAESGTRTTYGELAMRQLCTELSENAMASADAIAGWLREISYAYYEIKMLLAGQQLDWMRHFDGFRKRAELRQMGLGYESPGNMMVLMLGAATWLEAVLYIYIVNASMTLDLYRLGAGCAIDRAEEKLFSSALQDVGRQLTYGLDQMRSRLASRPEERQLVIAFLGRAEAALGADWLADRAMSEALAVLLGGDTREAFERGQAATRAFRRRSVENYLHRLSALGVEEERRAALAPPLKRAIAEPADAAAMSGDRWRM